MRPVHRPKAPTIDYRDKGRPNLRLLGGTLVLGMSIGAATVLLASMTHPVPRAEPAALPEAPALAARQKPERAADAPARPDAAAVDAYKAHELKNSLLKQAPSLRACYDAFLQDEPDVADGKVTIDFQIDPDGKVIAPGIVETELDDTALADCLVARVAGFAFPPPPDHQRTYAAHTFHFQRDVR